MHRSHRLAMLSAAGVSLTCCSGCGTNLEQVLLQTASAAGRTVLDIVLTELANALAEELRPDGPADGGNGTDDGNGDTPPDGGNGDGNIDDLVGDAAAGQAVYAGNNCAGCHCADAGGGCALSAPAIAGVSRQTLDESLRGTASHPVRVDLTDQEIVDLEAYLASL